MTEVTGDLRMFTFGHFMLSSIQQGIQAVHAITNMFTFYTGDDAEREILYSWATQHETLVCKNGGDCESLEQIETLFNHEDNHFPIGTFRESSGALNGGLTCLSIVLPERVYDEGKSVVFSRHSEYKYFGGQHHYWLNDVHYIYTDFEYNLIKLLRDCRHAQ